MYSQPSRRACRKNKCTRLFLLHFFSSCLPNWNFAASLYRENSKILEFFQSIQYHIRNFTYTTTKLHPKPFSIRADPQHSFLFGTRRHRRRPSIAIKIAFDLAHQPRKAKLMRARCGGGGIVKRAVRALN